MPSASPALGGFFRDAPFSGDYGGSAILSGAAAGGAGFRSGKVRFAPLRDCFELAAAAGAGGLFYVYVGVLLQRLLEESGKCGVLR